MPIPAQSLKSVPTVTYTDPTTHVSFKCPLAWKRVEKIDSYLPVPGLQPTIDRPLTGLSTRATFTFSPAGNSYAKTNLVALAFTYQTLPDSAQQSCSERIIDATEQSPSSTIRIQGVTLQHIDMNGVATCHQGESHLYWNAKAGTCHMFETDMLTLCEGLVDGTRGLTPHETEAFKRHIADIVQSIRIP